MKLIPVIDEEKCTVCKGCVFECPQDVFVFEHSEKIPDFEPGCIVVSAPENCTACEACIKTCLSGAITFS